MSYKLSIIIIGRNEEYMGRTIEDVLEHTSDKTEIIAVLDGFLPDPPFKPNPRITVIYNPVSVGQRAAVNQGVRLSTAKYVCKLDAHCAVDQDFDLKMIKAMEELGDNTTLIPVMRNMHVFDWVCPEGHRRYQSPSGVCQWIFINNQWQDADDKRTKSLMVEGVSYTVCSKPTVKDVVWIPKRSPATFTFRIDKTLHFQYYSELAKRPENIAGALKLDGVRDTNYRETMSIQGSCYMTTREKYLELDLTSEEFNSWGQNGCEVAMKTWLSGGQVIANLYTWYAHTFRTRGGDFGFPYPNPQDKVNENRELSRELFQKDKWPLATRKFQWVLDKFNPPDWGVTKGMIYYTPNDLDEKIAKPVRDQLQKIATDKKINITCSSLKKMDFGDKRVYFPSMKKGYLTMFKQILGALEKSSDDIVFFTEHDVLYHPSHFDFVPTDKNTFYYNQNVWLLRNTDGHALHYDVNQLSGLCVYREAALIHFRERYKMTEEAFKTMDEVDFGRFIRNMGFEPFTHGRVKWQNQFRVETWKSELPNIDIKHGANATGQRWNKDQYRNQSLLINWQETDDEIPGWSKTSEIIKQLQ